MRPPLEGIRDAFDIHPGAIYVNAASEGPIPKPARQVLLSVLERKSSPFRLGGEEYFQVPLRSRDLCASLVGCRPHEIALTAGTGAGINLAASALPLEPGDEILLLKGDFPALLNPFLHAKRRGVVPIEVVPSGKFPALSDFERAASRRTRILAISHVVQYDGFRHDLAALGRFCRDRDIWFVVDAAQSAGVLPLRFEKDRIDILAAPGHKWLLGLTGTGFVAIRESVMERMNPPAVGWMGCLSNAAQFIAIPPFDLALFQGGKKFEVGTTPYLQLAAWNESLDLILRVGVETIESHVLSLLAPLWEFLQGSRYKLISSPEASHRSAIVSFTGKFAAKQFKLLHEKNIFAGLRMGAIRISPHLYNTREEMDRIVKTLRELEGVKLEADRKGENL